MSSSSESGETSSENSDTETKGRNAGGSRSASSASNRSSRASSPASNASPSRLSSHSSRRSPESRKLSPSGSRSTSRTRSSSSSSSPRFVSATDSSSEASKKSSSTTSSRGKKILKAKDRKVSNKMAGQIKAAADEPDSDSESEQTRQKNSGSASQKASVKRPAAKPVRKKVTEKKADNSEEEGEIASDDSNKEFDDGLDDDLIGDDADRARLEEMTEREREEELFKRAENRENLRKRFEIQKKLKQQQKLRDKAKDLAKSHEKNQDDEEEEEGEAKSDLSDGESLDTQRKQDDDFLASYGGYGTIHEAKERSQDRRKNLDAMKYDKKSSALSELKAKRQERERKDMERAQRKGVQSKDEESDTDSPSKATSDSKSKRSAKGSGHRSRSSSSSSSSSSSAHSRRRSRSSSSTSAGSRSSSAASDTERFHKSPSRLQKYIETQEDLEPVRLSRFKLERFLHLPFFKKLVQGCFIRIGIGQFEGRSVYRAAEVVDVCETAKVYSLGKMNTNLGLRIRIGKQERVFRLEFISNQPISPQEFQKWKQTCEENSVALPTLDFVKSKAADIKKAMDYEFTSDDVDKIVAQKERFNKHPINYAMHKARLMKERDVALANGEEAKAKEFDQKLNELEERAEELDKKRTSTISSVSLINDRNRKANVSKAEQAIMNEIRRIKEEGVQSNPFTRRKCNPRIVTKNKQGVEINQDAATLLKLASSEQKENQLQKAVKAPAEADPKRKATVDAGASEAPHKKAKTSAAKEVQKEDLFDAHDFDIEIDVDTSSGPTNPVNVNVKPVTVVSKDAGPAKRSLNLDDYKKKRGLI